MKKDLFSSQGLRFDGSSYVPAFDQKRLTGQIRKIYNCMKDGKFRTLSQIQEETRAPQASISAQLRHLRKPRFGGHTVEKRRVGDSSNGLFEYQLQINNEPANENPKQEIKTEDLLGVSLRSCMGYLTELKGEMNPYYDKSLHLEIIRYVGQYGI